MTDLYPDRCSSCGLSRKQTTRHIDQGHFAAERANIELDETYRLLRAVIESCKHQPADAIRHQLVGLMPETRALDPEVATKMREKGMGHLVTRSEQNVLAGWASYGYPEPPAMTEERP
jgi:hypothetical protein